MVKLPEGVPTTSIDAGIVRAAQRGQVLTAEGEVWMGPGKAPTPTAPSNEPPRILDYLVGMNTWKTPENIKQQETGGFTFAQLRSLASQTVVSGAIYKAIDKIKKVEFTFTLTPRDGEKPQDAQLRAGKDPRITELRKFFESPDQDHEWPEWIANAWLQILTCDNLSIYRWPFAKFDGSADIGRPGAYALDIVDGDHIQPLIDAAGRVPRDPETPAYVQWTKGQPRKEFTRQELLYAMCWPSSQRVMGCSPIERMWFYLNVALRRDLTKLNWYTDGNIPAGLWPVDTEHWSPRDIEQAQTFIDLVASGKGRSKLQLMPGGAGSPIFPAEKALLDPFDDYLTRLACFFIGIPISSLIQEQNRATAENSRDSADEEGELPRINFTRRLLTKLVKMWWGYDDIVAQAKRDVEIDADKQSQIDDRGVRNGTIQIDEVRERDGRRPFGLPEGYVGQAGFIAFGASPIEGSEPMAGDEPRSIPGAQPIADPSGEVNPHAATGVVLNGAQVSAATAIVTAVAAGEIPRDSGVGQLMVLFNLTKEQADQIMGSAGNPKVETTPNPRPNVQPEPATPAIATAPTALAEDAQKAQIDSDAITQLILEIITADNGDLQLLAAPYHANAVKTGAKQVALGTLVTIHDPVVTEFLANKANQIVSVNDTTAKQIIRNVIAGMDAGDTPEAIAQQIGETYELRSLQARTIARQEVGSALNGGRFIQMTDDGVTRHEWLTSHDARVRESHTALDGEVVNVGEKFTNGLEFPQDPNGDASEVINCRCISLPLLGGAIPTEKARNSVLERGVAWRTAVGEILKLEAELTNAMNSYFADQKERVMKALIGAGVAA